MRAGRSKPGLKSQHIAGIVAAMVMSGPHAVSIIEQGLFEGDSRAIRVIGGYTDAHAVCLHLVCLYAYTSLNSPVPVVLNSPSNPI